MPSAPSHGATPASRPRLRKINQATGAIRCLYAQAVAAPERRSAGILMGSRDDEESIELTETLESAWSGELAADLGSSLTSLRGSGDGRESAVGLEPVGWYIVRPGSGGIASDTDIDVHRNGWLNWWQIALVIDPAQRVHSIYGWKGDEVQRLGGRKAELKKPRATRGAASLEPAQRVARSGGTSGESRDPRTLGQPPSGPARRRTMVPISDETKPRARAETPLSTRAALLVPLCAGVVGGVVLVIYR